MTYHQFLAEQKQQYFLKTAVLNILLTFFSFFCLYMARVEIAKYPVQTIIILVSIYIFYFIVKNTFDVRFAAIAAIVWGSGMLYLFVFVIAPALAVVPTPLNFDVVNTINTVTYYLK